jgi:hypothetical protein
MTEKRSQERGNLGSFHFVLPRPENHSCLPWDWGQEDRHTREQASSHLHLALIHIYTSPRYECYDLG